MADKKIMGALAYFLGFITGILFLLIEKKDQFVRFHAAQSTVLFLLLFVVNIVLTITIVGMILVPFLGLASIVLWLFMMWKAYSGEQYALPVVGEWAKKLL